MPDARREVKVSGGCKRRLGGSVNTPVDRGQAQGKAGKHTNAWLSGLGSAGDDIGQIPFGRESRNRELKRVSCWGATTRQHDDRDSRSLGGICGRRLR
jgi:hypothetical protein